VEAWERECSNWGRLDACTTAMLQAVDVRSCLRICCPCDCFGPAVAVQKAVMRRYGKSIATPECTGGASFWIRNITQGPPL
jgi:hypothetical protein